ncbi:putative acyltransferase [Actinomycetospora sp. NBRC 106375]|uniref:lysophospholipid acyltransferase family protein n=1 Tax=Actinomycetospora sp. NBRC 106375 TaxID=3032207 RepID=UPI0024A1D093|nr:lysophospholipid acyltransferase family protein [Actinomycetospora sp. NBRC 106375]GLZ44801.1 putative acyltransferase [Actinomycetospora sp. NBRC 106375]
MPEARVIPLHAEGTEGGRRPRPRPAPRRASRPGVGSLAERTAAARGTTVGRDQDTGEAGETGVAPTGGEVAALPTPQGPTELEARVAEVGEFLQRRLTGRYAVDDFGFDRDLTENVVMPVLRPLYEHWFRVETIGTENVPLSGGALLVANHSGTLPLDALMTTVAAHDDLPVPRYLRMLAADLVFGLPGVGAVARKAGHTLACNADAEALLSAGELVGVWPEGFKGIGKDFADRYKLQRFGRGGFVSAALRTGVPIVPCSIVGAEEIYPKIADLGPLARLLGFPYFPITPTWPLLGPLGLVPLPSKWYIEFGEPIPTDVYDPGAADDPMLVFNLTDQVRENIQQTLYRLLAGRRNAFLG